MNITQGKKSSSQINLHLSDLNSFYEVAKMPELNLASFYLFMFFQ